MDWTFQAGVWFGSMSNQATESGHALQVAGRMVKYSYYIARISSFIASKMQSSVTKNLVFPSCGDIRILQLMVRAALFSVYHLMHAGSRPAWSSEGPGCLNVDQMSCFSNHKDNFAAEMWHRHAIWQDTPLPSDMCNAWYNITLLPRTLPSRS